MEKFFSEPRVIVSIVLGVVLLTVLAYFSFGRVKPLEFAADLKYGTKIIRVGRPGALMSGVEISRQYLGGEIPEGCKQLVDGLECPCEPQDECVNADAVAMDEWRLGRR